LPLGLGKGLPYGSARWQMIETSISLFTKWTTVLRVTLPDMLGVTWSAALWVS